MDAVGLFVYETTIFTWYLASGVLILRYFVKVSFSNTTILICHKFLMQLGLFIARQIMITIIKIVFKDSYELVLGQEVCRLSLTYFIHSRVPFPGILMCMNARFYICLTSELPAMCRVYDIHSK